MNRKLTTFFLGIMISFVFGQTANEIQKIEDFIIQSMEENKIIGSAFTISTTENDLLTRGYGHLYKGGPEVNVNTTFEIASLTKSFTALAIIQLAMDGKINLEDPVIKYLPDFKTKNKEVSDQITLLNLLNHNSGFTTVQGNRYQSVYENKPNTLETVVSDYSKTKLIFLPGEHYEYSNSNYQILGLIIEKVTLKSYEQYIYNRIFQVLGMNFSGFEANENTAIPHRYIMGYPTAYVNNSSRTIVAQGGIFSSIGDMKKYLNAFLQRDTLLLPQEGYKLIFESNQPGLDHYGFAGWNRKKLKDSDQEIDVFWHGGTNIGYVTNMFIIPSKNMAIAAFANTASFFDIHSSSPLCYGPINLFFNISAQMHNPTLGYIIIALWLIPLYLLIILLKKLILQTKPVSSFRIIIKTIILSGLVYLLTNYIPNQLGSNDLKTVISFEPIVGYFLVVTSILLATVQIVDYIIFFKYKRKTI